MYKLMSYGPLADRLRTWRKAAGLDQSAVAGRLGVKQQTVSGWERGENRPSLKNLGRLAELYGSSLDDMMHVYMADVAGEPAHRQIAADTVAEIRTHGLKADEVREILDGLQTLLRELEEDGPTQRRRPSDTETDEL